MATPHSRAQLLRNPLFGLALLASPAFADCGEDAELAVAFMNQYLALIVETPERDVTQWLREQPLASAELAAAYAAEQARGRAIDAEMGWGVDLLLDAQDSPDQGFTLAQCGPAPDHVQLRGIDWTEFRVTLRLADTPHGRRVAGAGRINIGEAERAPR
ncbi:hypothetical protein LRS11_14205 [Pseudomonas sp. J452]|uniref:hypothetical protein n=1 Tax=Pseudomonas sp. J452 TaxID=2898441 RepID=UPI0021ADA7F9|nr:hypothetical protein [Pseudomonas sp. J452]UUY06987.1 hypothetical protein LRS11_14205 [Pseudomonas sp. J452]